MANKKRVVYTQTGPVEWSEADLEACDKASRKRLAHAQKDKLLAVDGPVVRLKLTVRGSFSHDAQDMLKSLVNIHWHGKAYAPEEASEGLKKAHNMNRSQEFHLPIQYNLETGEVTVDVPHAKGV